MRHFVVKRNDQDEIRGVEVYPESDFIGVATAEDLARIEGLEPTVFLGADLLDVVRTAPRFFEEVCAR